MSVNDETDDERKRPPNQKVILVPTPLFSFPATILVPRHYSRSHAPRGNAEAPRLRCVPEKPLRSAEIPRSHAARGNEK